MEIDRQVAQSNAIAEKAVGETERTNAAVKELDEAAQRIGDVVKLITASPSRPICWRSTPPSRRRAPAKPAAASPWWRRRSRRWPARPPRRPRRSPRRSPACSTPTERSIEAIGAIERTIREIGEISGAIAAAVTEQGAATQEIARSVEIAARRTSETAEEVATRRTARPARRTRSAGAVLDASQSLSAEVDASDRGSCSSFFVALRTGPLLAREDCDPDYSGCGASRSDRASQGR